jgi:hypothetical protein
MFSGARLLARSAASRPFRYHLAIAGSLLACLAIAGCGEDEPEAPPRAASADRRGRGPVAVTSIEEQQKSVEGRLAPKKPPPPDPYDNPGSNKEAVADALAAAVEEKPRDYPAELLSAVRGAESCVQPRTASAALPTEVLISLEALVLESGTIVSGTARAPVLTPEELECVKRRLESTRLPDKVKDAPRRVSAALKLTFKPQQPTAGAPGANTAAAPAAAPTPSAY